MDIITKSSDQEKGILLKIKKVHGKYLLKYLSIDKLEKQIKDHGTVIKLFVRSDVDLENIEEELKKWILVPNCKLVLNDNGKSTVIGSKTVSDLLKSYLTDLGYAVDGKTIQIKEIDKDGITLAYALRYIENWKEWDFLDYHESARTLNPPIGVCIEGIRVDFNTPGFNGKFLYALVNTSGKNAPKTNVARSNIEITPEREQLLLNVYTLYLEHIANELQNLRNLGFSITWAASEANFILNSITRPVRHYSGRDERIEDSGMFDKALSQLKCILIEKKEKREIISIDELKSLKHFWTIDCASYSSADSLLKEVKSSNTSALSLLKSIFDVEGANTQHVDVLLCNKHSNKAIDKIISDNFQVSSIKLIPEQRRLDLRWTYTNDKIWEQLYIERDENTPSNLTQCFLQLKEIEQDESINQTAINSSNALFILLNSELNKFLVKVVSNLSAKSQEDLFVMSKLINLIYNLFFYKDLDRAKVEEIIEARLERSNNRDIGKMIWDRVKKEELISAILKTSFIKYDTTIWYRRNMY